METIIIIGWILAAVVWRCVIASFMKTASAMKGYGNETHAFAICLWFGVLGCLYVIALPDKIQQSQNQKIIELLESKNNENLPKM